MMILEHTDPEHFADELRRDVSAKLVDEPIRHTLLIARGQFGSQMYHLVTYVLWDESRLVRLRWPLSNHDEVTSKDVYEKYRKEAVRYLDTLQLILNGTDVPLLPGQLYHLKEERLPR